MKTIKTTVYQRLKTSIFQKGLVHRFGQKCEILLTFRFGKIDPQKVFSGVLVRKQGLLDNIKMDLKRRQNWHFCKGDSP